MSVVEWTESCWADDWYGVVAALVKVGRVDLCLGRLVEGHADAMRILQQADAPRRDGVYGVWASRSAGTGLVAERGVGGSWRLSGEMRFASGVDLIDRVLVPGWLDDEHHLLFDVPAGGFTPRYDSWPTPAMDGARSFTCTCRDLDAGAAIGPRDFYLRRPGFLLGGLGPAAVWTGGAHLVADLVSTGLGRFAVTDHQQRRLGTLLQAVWSAEAALSRAVAAIEDTTDADVAATEVSHARTAVATGCDVVRTEAEVVVGPGGLSTNGRLVRALADLAIYVRQHHLDATLQGYGRTRLALDDRR
jgi:hypothetical protein